MDYVVLYEGKVYGPFTTNDGVSGDATTDAQQFRNQHAPGSPIMELIPASGYFDPFPPSEATG